MFIMITLVLLITVVGIIVDDVLDASLSIFFIAVAIDIIVVLICFIIEGKKKKEVFKDVKTFDPNNGKCDKCNFEGKWEFIGKRNIEEETYQEKEYVASNFYEQFKRKESKMPFIMNVNEKVYDLAYRCPNCKKLKYITKHEYKRHE